MGLVLRVVASFASGLLFLVYVFPSFMGLLGNAFSDMGHVFAGHVGVAAVTNPNTWVFLFVLMVVLVVITHIIWGPDT